MEPPRGPRSRVDGANVRVEKRRIGKCKSDEREKRRRELGGGGGGAEGGTRTGAPRTTPTAPLTWDPRRAAFKTRGHRRSQKAPDLRKVPGTETAPSPQAPALAAGGGPQTGISPPERARLLRRARSRGRDARLGTRHAEPVALECAAARDRPPAAATRLGSSPGFPRAAGEREASRGEKRPRSLGFPEQPCHSLAAWPWTSTSPVAGLPSLCCKPRG